MASPSDRRKAERFRLRQEYFALLKETGEAVDGKVEYFIHSFFLPSDFQDAILERYDAGKRQMRAGAVRLAHELVDGRDWHETIVPAASLVLRDAAYYCIDDVLDKGADPKGGMLDAAAFLSLSQNILTHLDRRELLPPILDEIAELDQLNGNALLLEDKMNEEATYLDKARGYNFWEQAMRIGGIVAGADEATLQRLGTVGKNIGIAHIIANDTYDFAKDLEDFREGKRTLPMLYAFSRLRGKDEETFSELFGRRILTEEEREAVRRIVVRNGIIDRGKEKAKEYVDLAVEALQAFPDTRARQLLEFAPSMTQKNKHYALLERYR